LTAKQARFIAEYLKDLNGKQAAIRAGYKPSNAESTASTLLQDPKVSQAVTAGKAEQLAVAGLSAQRVLEELARVAFSNVRDWVDPDGHLKPLHELRDSTTGAVASIELLSTPEQGDRHTVHKIRLWDKARALELLAKHYALLTERVAHEGEIVYRWIP
jgi:phage terminase small subunit